MPHVIDEAADGVTLVLRTTSAYVTNTTALLGPGVNDGAQRAANRALINRFTGLCPGSPSSGRRLDALSDVTLSVRAAARGDPECRGVYGAVRPLADDDDPDADDDEEPARDVIATMVDIGQIQPTSSQAFAIRIDEQVGLSGPQPWGEWLGAITDRWHAVRGENGAHDEARRAANAGTALRWRRSLRCACAPSRRRVSAATVPAFGDHGRAHHAEMASLDRRLRRFDSDVRRTSWMSKMARDATRRRGADGRRSHVMVVGKGGLHAARGHESVGCKSAMRTYAIWGDGQPVFVMGEANTSQRCSACRSVAKMQSVAEAHEGVPFDPRRRAVTLPMSRDRRGERCRNTHCRYNADPWRHDEAPMKNFARTFQAALTGEAYPYLRRRRAPQQPAAPGAGGGGSRVRGSRGRRRGRTGAPRAGLREPSEREQRSTRRKANPSKMTPFLKENDMEDNCQPLA